MNSVSSFIYWAEVCENLQTLLIALIMILAFVSFVLFCTSVALVENNAEKSKHVAKYLLITVSVVVLMSILRIFTPSQKTMLAIAASETTGVIINSPETKKMIDTLQKTLEKNLEK